MKKVLVALAQGFEEIETITVVDILRRSGARVTLAGLSEGPVEGSRGVHVMPDCLLSAVDPVEFEMIVLPGGMPGTSNLQKDPGLLDILRQMHSGDKFIAAICAAPLVLQTAGILKGDHITSHPSVREKLNGVNYEEERVVVDGKIITSRSPGTAMEFAMKLVECLFGIDRVHIVNEGVLAKL
ncbi:MAG: DJ-1/PfpI family protein [Candidatus Nitrohelix vancouverensis]|uniref:DJ-1/PfpI family protein n=1 Tax=Candidatus Nitrohelix vancouverensis TaxID=2705534 RepID=A0A7T0C3L5_9BACT|nr:MAG: DJ-1/PfpI family protein [Candidatus Nitrohelix vancouverensis]